MLLRCPINTCEPFSLFMHHALSAYWPHGARKQFEPRRNPSLCLYRRSQAHLPTRRRSRPFHRGTSPLQALTNKTGRWRSMVAPGESARSGKIAAVRAVTCVDTRRYPPTYRVKDIQAVNLGLCYGWIAGQRKSYDNVYYLQKYVPRRPRSRWSQVNVAKAEELIAARRMAWPRSRQHGGELMASTSSWRNAGPGEARQVS